MNWKIVAILCMVSAILGGAIVKRYAPNNIIKEVETVKDHIITVTKIKENSDGSKETTVTQTQDKTSTDTKINTKTVKMPDWHVSFGADLSKAYSLNIERRILGPVFIGASLNTTNTLGVTLGVEF